MASPLTILEGSTFCICDEKGDVGVHEPSGFFTRDTRFLSVYCMTLNGERPLMLSSGKVDYFSAAFYLRNPMAGELPQDCLSIVRERFVGDGMQDTIRIQNQSMEPLSFELGLEVGSDFADIMSVKERDFFLGDPLNANPLPPLGRVTFDEDESRFVIVDSAAQNGHGARTQVNISQPGRVEDNKVFFAVTLEPRETWSLEVDVVPSLDGTIAARQAVQQRFGEERTRVSASLSTWQLRVPQLRATWDHLGFSFQQSVADLASLRMRAGGRGIALLPAAGMPWFMTVFGRDTIITCLQTLLFGPELAHSALDVLAELQATEDDPSIDAEPGKIVHELRQGKAAEHWFQRYYGTVDATPLYLVLLSEVWRWTDDADLAKRLREPAVAALNWIDEWGDRDGDGFVEYQRRNAHGLENQTWKDSGDSQRFRDGSIAEGPIAAAEVQGYVYDAKVRMAEIAREVWRDRELADRLERDAAELKRRFDEAFWVEDRGGYYALALDGKKQKVDALCSNIGHLLWSGIVPEERVDQIVDQLMGEALWSGWGVRTMSTEDAGYNPLSYHNGTVWPHDNSLVAWGLARYGRWPEAQRIVHRMLTAAKHFGYQLPEVFSGLPRAETPFPVAYPTAARPQAWAAGTPVLLLQILLGLRPNRTRHRLESTAPEEMPSWIGDVRLSGVRCLDRMWDIRLRDGRVTVEEA